MKNVPSILQIGEILVSSEILTECFCCDYETCRGACCIIGESGAPLQESELEPLERDYPHYEAWMSVEGRAKIEESGFFVLRRDDARTCEQTMAILERHFGLLEEEL